jgi:hypothetical protein
MQGTEAAQDAGVIGQQAKHAVEPLNGLVRIAAVLKETGDLKGRLWAGAGYRQNALKTGHGVLQHPQPLCQYPVKGLGGDKQSALKIGQGVLQQPQSLCLEPVGGAGDRQMHARTLWKGQAFSLSPSSSMRSP